MTETNQPEPTVPGSEETSDNKRLQVLQRIGKDQLKGCLHKSFEALIEPTAENFESALRSGNFELCNKLIEQKPELLHGSYDGKSAFAISLECGFSKIAGMLIGSPSFELDAPNCLPLRLALEFGHNDLALRLLNLGACPNVRQEGKKSLLVEALERHFTDVAENMLSHGAEVDIRDGRGWTPLIYFAFKGMSEEVDFLLKHGAKVNLTNNDGWPAVVGAAANGHEAVCEMLLKAGAVFPQKFAQAALVSAYKKRNIAIFGKLLETGIDPNFIFADKETMLGQTVQDEELTFTELLLDHGADPNTLLSNGKPVFMTVISLRCEKLAMKFLNRGASPNRNDGFWMPLHAATQAGMMNLVKALVEKGSSLSSCDKRGNTALHRACFADNSELAGFLISKGIAKDISNSDGKTALDYARTNTCYRLFLQR